MLLLHSLGTILIAHCDLSSVWGTLSCLLAWYSSPTLPPHLHLYYHANPKDLNHMGIKMAVETGCVCACVCVLPGCIKCSNVETGNGTKAQKGEGGEWRE